MTSALPVKSAWRIELLGGPRAVSGARTITRFPTYKTAALLAYLAHYRNQTHGRDETAELLWPGDDPTAVRARLNQAVSTLRRQLEPPGTPPGAVLISDRIRIGLNPDTVISDTALFDMAVRAARRADSTSEECIRHLREAADLYQGELLPGYYEEWMLGERERLAETFRAALRDLVGLLVERGAAEDALPYAHRLVESDRYNEEGQNTLIRLYLTLDRPVLALKQYADFERLLSADGETPPPTTRNLEVEARQRGRLEPRSGAAKTAESPARKDDTLPIAGPPPPNLPPRFTPFFGREREREEIFRLLEAGTSLLTLTGPGGIGKTRLSLEGAHLWAGKETGGRHVVFVSLAEIADARHLPEAILRSLGRPTGEGADALPGVLLGLLAGRHGLLILDNFEHLVEDGAATVQRLRDRLPDLALLVTSRRPLGLDGERELTLDPLPTPPPVSSPEELLRYPAIQMFVDRMQAVRADFQLTPRNAETVARLCQGLEGIPLALELAATWAQSLTPAQMLSRLSRRFDLLVSRRRDIPPRHRTLRAAIEYSYQQLSPPQRSFLTRLSVFVGGWSLEAAAHVAAAEDVPDTGVESSPLTLNTQHFSRESAALTLLTDLRDGSLIVAGTEADEVAEMRFHMLDSIREFAEEQLTQATRAHAEEAHAEYFVRLAEAIQPRLRGGHIGEALHRLDADHDNLRAALRRCLSRGDAIRGMRLAGAIWRYWRTRGHLREGREWLTALLELPDAAQASPKVRSLALTGLGGLAWTQGDYPAAEIAHRAALVLRRATDDTRGVLASLTSLAICAYRQARYDEAEELLSEVLRDADANRYEDVHWSAQLNLGNIYMMRRQEDEARSHYTRCLEWALSVSDQDRAASARNNLGVLAYYGNHLDRARTHHEEALMTRLELGQKGGIAVSLLNLARVEVEAGMLIEGEARLRECLPLLDEIEDRFTQAEVLMVAAMLRQKQNRPTDAVRLLAALFAARQRLSSPVNPRDQERLDRLRAEVEAELPPEDFADAWSLGSLLSMEEALRLSRQ
jgi:predicted ATPase/DNA-binding SARP family transcriptional activator